MEATQDSVRPVALNWTGYNPAFDGLRGIAVTSVVLFHAAPSILPGGWWGVDMFFVLSGFLITSLLIREVNKSGSINRLAFYARRALRLWPAFALVLAFCTALAIGSNHPREELEIGYDVGSLFDELESGLRLVPVGALRPYLVAGYGRAILSCLAVSSRLLPSQEAACLDRGTHSRRVDTADCHVYTRILKRPNL